jgi:hypothetical protein
MTQQQLLAAILETLRAYWRMRAAMALIRYSEMDEFDQPLSYVEIPPSVTVSSILDVESARSSIEATFLYVDHGRLSVDVFLRIISHLEEFYAARLIAVGASPDGTLGNLQARCEQAYGVSGILSQKIDEIRERRNAFIHHHGVPTIKHVAAAGVVYGLSNGAIEAPGAMSVLSISDEYLVYCMDSINSYASLF